MPNNPSSGASSFGPPVFFNDGSGGGSSFGFSNNDGADGIGDGMGTGNDGGTPEYQLITAEILYHMPDHHSVLQTFIWQNLDLFPVFPELKKFLDYWTQNLDGPLHTVNVCYQELLKPRSFTLYSSETTVH